MSEQPNASDAAAQRRHAYASATEVHSGTRLLADGGFTCLNAGSIRVVMKSADGLYVRCRCGSHYLDGQLDDGHYIGFSIARTKQP